MKLNINYVQGERQTDRHLKKEMLFKIIFLLNNFSIIIQYSSAIRQIDRQTDRKTDRKTDRNAERDRETDRDGERESERQTDRQTGDRDRQRNRDRQRDIKGQRERI